MRRGEKGNNTRSLIAGTIAQQDYAKMFNVVDRNDRDSADFSTSITTNRFYLMIFCWLLDRVVHTEFLVIIYLVESGMGLACWKL